MNDYNTSNSSQNLEIIYTSKLNENAYSKARFIRGNSKSHFNKILRKAILKRSTLRNLTNKTQNSTDIQNFDKEQEIVIKKTISDKYTLFFLIKIIRMEFQMFY